MSWPCVEHAVRMGEAFSGVDRMLCMGEVARDAEHAGARSAQRIPQAQWYVQVVAFLELYGSKL